MKKGKEDKTLKYFLKMLTALLLFINILFIMASFVSPNEQYLLYMSILYGSLFLSGLIAYSIWIFYYKQDNPTPTFSELRLMKKTGTNKKADSAYDITKFFVVWCFLEFLFMAICLFTVRA